MAVEPPTVVSEGSDQRLLGMLDGAWNVLVLAPSLGGVEDQTCGELLKAAAPDHGNFLSVTFTQSPDARLDIWREHVSEEPPARTGVITVNDDVRSSSGPSDPTRLPGELTIDTVSSPTDLTGLGMKLSQLLAEWEGNDNRTVVCFHSLTTLMQYAETNRVFRFLHVITGRLKHIDAFSHYHMDPSAHDERTINTILTLFDAVVEVDVDGQLTARSR